MDTTETYIKMCEKAREIQDTKRYNAYSITSPSDEALILDTHDFYGIHEDGVYYPDATIGIYNVWNSTVFGYVSNVPTFGCAVDGDRIIRYKLNEVIWLPRQDQLQEILFKEWQPMDLTAFIEGFEDYIGGLIVRDVNESSMEQLWLAFVMKEKYNKIWNGEDWKEEG